MDHRHSLQDWFNISVFGSSLTRSSFHPRAERVPDGFGPPSHSNGWANFGVGVMHSVGAFPRLTTTPLRLFPRLAMRRRALRRPPIRHDVEVPIVRRTLDDVGRAAGRRLRSAELALALTAWRFGDTGLASRSTLWSGRLGPLRQVTSNIAPYSGRVFGPGMRSRPGGYL